MTQTSVQIPLSAFLLTCDVNMWLSNNAVPQRGGQRGNRNNAFPADDFTAAVNL